MEKVCKQETDELEGHADHGVPDEGEECADGKTIYVDVVVASGAGWREDSSFPIGWRSVCGGLFIRWRFLLEVNVAALRLRVEVGEDAVVDSVVVTLCSGSVVVTAREDWELCHSSFYGGPTIRRYWCARLSVGVTMSSWPAAHNPLTVVEVMS